MIEDIEVVLDWLENHAVLETFIYSLALLGVAWFANSVIKVVLVKLAFRFLQAIPYGNASSGNRLIKRLANILPAVVISAGIVLIPGINPMVVTVVQNVTNAFIVLTIALALSDAFDIGNTLYQTRKDAYLHPIKGYVQVAKIIVFVIATVLIVATLIDRSPLILLSGIGAMAAVLMLIFQDTLLSLVASIQISSNDIVRVGDWIEMPQLHADGDVIDVALHTVKVQNWDKTITTIPTKRLISESFKNWRGMQESGGRRIKRSMHIDQNSIRFLDADAIQKLRSFSLLQDYLTQKSSELAEWNRKLTARGLEPVNARRVTNIGTFRAYVESYLRNHPLIHQDMTLMVRQMSPTSEGLPLEIYCFTKTTQWTEYEAIQSDIFDHLIAVVNQFDLRVFQNPTGQDFAAWSSNRMRA